MQQPTAGVVDIHDRTGCSVLRSAFYVLRSTFLVDKDNMSNPSPSSLDQLIEKLHISQQHLHQLLAGFLHDPDWQPAPGQWSLREIAAHLVEAEEGCLLKRIRLIATGERPHFDFYLNSEDDLSQYDMLDSLERWFNARQWTTNVG